jgi:hypothetical protein
MAQFEYRVMHMPAGSIGVLNERLNSAAEEGWHPILMSGNEVLNVLLRRQTQESPAAQQ